eukprot:TRINITY_DN603_c0_g2_i6.p1 TRINITY_DN603_c0_g2~~TRINITY_DN603_c0_g2_i6.p1  ORF type:complete len:280 (-),score=9.15 TRINITY_DN603_c0_g2_i6:1827-2666(-)
MSSQFRANLAQANFVANLQHFQIKNLAKTHTITNFTLCTFMELCIQQLEKKNIQNINSLLIKCFANVFVKTIFQCNLNQGLKPENRFAFGSFLTYPDINYNWNIQTMILRIFRKSSFKNGTKKFQTVLPRVFLVQIFAFSQTQEVFIQQQQLNIVTVNYQLIVLGIISKINNNTNPPSNSTHPQINTTNQPCTYHNQQYIISKLPNKQKMMGISQLICEKLNNFTNIFNIYILKKKRQNSTNDTFNGGSPEKKTANPHLNWSSHAKCEEMPQGLQYCDK